MELGTDLIAGLRDQLGLCPEQSAAESPDWLGLHSRLAAGHAAREVLLFSGGGLAGSGLAGQTGSFAGMVQTRGWSTGQSSRAINPNISLDGKGPAGNEAVDAGQGVAGGRG